MKTFRSLWRLLKISWKFLNVKALAIFFFKVINLIKYFRRILCFIFLAIHLMLFFDIFGWFELFLFYWLLFDVSGPNIDKYVDFDEETVHNEEEKVHTFDYVLPKEEF